MKLFTANFHRQLSTQLLAAITKRITALMSAQTDALKAVVASIVPQILTAISNEAALKQKYDAAIADNVAKAAQIADLQAQLAAGNPTDTQSVVDATAALQAVVQPLADANTVNAPGN